MTVKAIELLTAYALKNCDNVPALRKLENDIKPKVMQVLATFAFADYSRSAASTRTCDCCGGKKFIDAEVMTMKKHRAAVPFRAQGDGESFVQ